MIVRLPIKEYLITGNKVVIEESISSAISNLNKFGNEDQERRANRITPPDAETQHMQTLNKNGSNPDGHDFVHKQGMNNFKTGQKMSAKEMFDMKRTQSLHS